MRHRLLRHPLGRWVDPSVVWPALLGEATNSFWLDGGPDATTGTSYLGASARVLTDADGDIFDNLRSELAGSRLEAGPVPGFSLGWVGWLGYELRAATMGEPVRASRYPDAALMFVDRALAFDHETREVWLLALALGGEVLGEEVLGGRPLADEPLADETLVEEVLVEEVLGGRPLVEEVLGGRPLVEEVLGGRPLADAPLPDEPMPDVPMGEAPPLDESGTWPPELAAWRDATAETLAALSDEPDSAVRRGITAYGGGNSPRRDQLSPAGLGARARGGGRNPRHDVQPAPSVAWRYTDDEYLAMIVACQRAITAGDAYQLCLTTEATVNVSPDPFATYLALRASSPTHHGGLVVVGDVALLSASPEQFLAVSPGGLVSSSPIKGTRRRGTDVADDERQRTELEQSGKERAENLMIVDLMRNDIGRISEVGSVRVPRLLEVESYAHVHQLVSEVTGRLAPGLDAVDAVLAAFPAGSMTGAPKLSATRILDELERRPRGIYAGAFGYFGLDGAVDLAMVIRSIVIDPAGSTIGSGGGITALSVPDEELDEVRLKAAALLAVLGVDGNVTGAHI